ncbi:MAG: RNA polymerase sigma factor [Saprospiraceae bacterium]|nr:RNA polymerase sigma factor [Saprospiraceae bacterium]
MHENDLIAGLLKGNEKSFEQLVGQYQEMIGSVCMGFVQNQTEAEELTQDVFVEVFQSIQKFKGNSKLSTWLYRIAVNKSINLVNHKKRKRQINKVSIFFGFREEKEKDFKDHGYRSAEQNMENEEVKKALEQALAKLPENQRTAFVLRKYEELSYTEMSEIMEVSVSAIESLIHRASKNMKKHLKYFYSNYYLT